MAHRAGTVSRDGHFVLRAESFTRNTTLPDKSISPPNLKAPFFSTKKEHPLATCLPLCAKYNIGSIMSPKRAGTKQLERNFPAFFASDRIGSRIFSEPESQVGTPGGVSSSLTQPVSSKWPLFVSQCNSADHPPPAS